MAAFGRTRVSSWRVTPAAWGTHHYHTVRRAVCESAARGPRIRRSRRGKPGKRLFFATRRGARGGAEVGAAPRARACPRRMPSRPASRTKRTRARCANRCAAADAGRGRGVAGSFFAPRTSSRRNSSSLRISSRIDRRRRRLRRSPASASTASSAAFDRRSRRCPRLALGQVTRRASPRLRSRS